MEISGKFPITVRNIPNRDVFRHKLEPLTQVVKFRECALSLLYIEILERSSVILSTTPILVRRSSVSFHDATVVNRRPLVTRLHSRFLHIVHEHIAQPERILRHPYRRLVNIRAWMVEGVGIIIIIIVIRVVRVVAIVFAHLVVALRF